MEANLLTNYPNTFIIFNVNMNTRRVTVKSGMSSDRFGYRELVSFFVCYHVTLPQILYEPRPEEVVSGSRFLKDNKKRHKFPIAKTIGTHA